MKACAACGARNVERSQFCHDCGGRLPAKGEEQEPSGAGATLPEGGSRASAEPATSPVAPVAAPVAASVVSPSLPTPSAPVAGAAVTGTTCGSCGYRVPPGQTVSWCPGCGQLFDIPVAGASGASSPSAAPIPSAPVAASTPTRPLAAEPIPAPPGWALVLLRAGERVDRYPLRKGEVTLGRTEGEYTFPDDPLLSARHARLFSRGRTFWLEDAGSRNGTYLRLTGATELRHGDVVTFGSLVLRYESQGGGPCSTSLITEDGGVKLFGSGRERARGRLVRILQDGSDGPIYPLTPSRTIVGRKLGHFLFPEDPLLSRQHAQFYERDGEMWVEDLGSSNGTMLRLRGPAELAKGMVFRIGDVTLEVAAP